MRCEGSWLFMAFALIRAKLRATLASRLYKALSTGDFTSFARFSRYFSSFRASLCQSFCSFSAFFSARDGIENDWGDGI